MNIKEAKRNVANFLGHPQKFLNEKDTLKTKEVYNIIFIEIDLLMNDKKVPLDKIFIQKVIDITLIISSRLLQVPVNDNLSVFIKSYSEIIHNWSVNTHNNFLLTLLCRYMSKTIIDRNQIIKTTNVLFELQERMQDLASWLPPSYEISKAYFEKLLEINDSSDMVSQTNKKNKI